MTKVKSRILINLAYSQRLQYTALKVIYILLVCIFSGYIFAFLVLKMWELSFILRAMEEEAMGAGAIFGNTILLDWRKKRDLKL